MGAALVADVQGLGTSWAAIYGESESATGAKTATLAEKKSARLGLQLELLLNLLAIAQNFPRQPARLDIYI